MLYQATLRPFIFTLVLGLVFVSVGSAQQPALKKVKLMLDWFPQAENGGYFCALAEGYYQKAGLDVEIDSVSTRGSVEPMVVAGAYDFGLSTADRVITAQSRNIPLVGVLASMEHDPTAVMVHAESPVKTFPDLEGHAIAIPPGVLWLKFLIKKYNFHHVTEAQSTFEVATFMHSPDYLQECLVTAEPYVMAKYNVKIRTLLLMDAGYDPYHLLITSENYLTENPETVRTFVEASREGWRHYLGDPAKADAEIMKRNREMTTGQLDFSRKALQDGHFIEGFADRHEDVGLMTDERFHERYQILCSLGLINQDLDYHKAFTTQFLSPAPAK